MTEHDSFDRWPFRHLWQTPTGDLLRITVYANGKVLAETPHSTLWGWISHTIADTWTDIGPAT